MVDNQSRKVLVLIGPTASGKTALSLALADYVKVEVISADSRQIYRYMDIGTAKPSPEERRKVKHYFIDELNPDEDFNAGVFGKQGREIIDDMFHRNIIPLVVGGSGLYIRSLVDGLFEGPGANDEIRNPLYERLHKEGAQPLLDELEKIDPTAASTMLVTNTRRIIRALEVYYDTGIPISQLHQFKCDINFKPLFVGLEWQRKTLYDRINLRVERMIEQGLEEEVKALQSRGYGPELKALKTVGYREVFDYFARRITRARMIVLIKQNSRRFAKRQITWFRPDTRIHWFALEVEKQLPDIAKQIASLYESRLP